MLHGVATAALVGCCLKQHHPFRAMFLIFCLITDVTGAEWFLGISNIFVVDLVGVFPLIFHHFVWPITWVWGWHSHGKTCTG